MSTVQRSFFVRYLTPIAFTITFFRLALKTSYRRVKSFLRGALKKVPFSSVVNKELTRYSPLCNGAYATVFDGQTQARNPGTGFMERRIHPERGFHGSRPERRHNHGTDTLARRRALCDGVADYRPAVHGHPGP
jgi:hypothetical protein